MLYMMEEMPPWLNKSEYHEQINQLYTYTWYKDDPQSCNA